MLSIRETATLRAALRYWQDEMAPHDVAVARPYFENCDTEPLTRNEITHLISRLERAAIRYVATKKDTDKVVSARLLREHEVHAGNSEMVWHTVITAGDAWGSATSPSSSG